MLVTLDFETYYDDEYTLRKMSTSEYVRDPRFEALCVGIKVDDKPTKVYWGDEIAPALEVVRGNEVLCHHAHFDGLILSHHYGIYPSAYRCTLSMARALRPKTVRNDLNTVAEAYGRGNKLPEILGSIKGKHLADLTPQERLDVAAYCGQDVDLAHAVYTLDMLPVFPPRELDVISLVVSWFAQPQLALDVDRAKREQRREHRARTKLIKASGVTEADLSSAVKFCAALRALGIEPPMKPSPSVAGKMIPALAQTDTGLAELQRHPDAKIAALVAGRLAAKSTQQGTRIARLLKAGANDQALPIYVNYCGAHTTRGSGGDKCLAGTSEITVLREGAILCIMLSQLRSTDEVWDGVAFVNHGGLMDRGRKEVITHDNLTGTEDHKVRSNGRWTTLGAARESNDKLESGAYPAEVEAPAEAVPSS